MTTKYSCYYPPEAFLRYFKEKYGIDYDGRQYEHNKGYDDWMAGLKYGSSKRRKISFKRLKGKVSVMDLVNGALNELSK